MPQSSTLTTRSYRIYLRDSENRLVVGVDVDFTSDQEAREHAAQMLDTQANHRCAEVWDRARLVCTVHKEGAAPEYRGSLNRSPPASPERAASPKYPRTMSVNKPALPTG